MNLTIQQGQVLAHDGDLLVVGGPGCGKTTIALLKASRRVQQGLEPGQAVLFLSFSRSAIAQIQRAASITLSPTERERVQVHTFHSFCWDILRAHGHLLGLPATLEVLAPEEVVPLRVRCGAACWPQRERELAFAEGRITFDLFTPLTRELLTRSAYLRRLLSACFPLVIVDEFQDTDDAQLAVVTAITEGNTLVALGDQDQRIHDYRPDVPADRIPTFVALRRPRVITLVQNHRSSSRTHLAYARHVLQPDLGPAARGPVRIETYAYPNQVASRIKKVIRTLEDEVRVRRGGCGEVSVAVLGTTNETVRQLSRALNRPTPAADYSLSHEAYIDAVAMTSGWRFAFSLLDAPTELIEARVSLVLRRLADHFCCARDDTDETVTRLEGWAAELQTGSRPKRAAVIDHLTAAVRSARGIEWTGDPLRDVQRLRALIATIETKYVAEVADVLELCCPVRPGNDLCESLSQLFLETGSYAGAEAVVRHHLALDGMTDRARESRGRSVMTLHKSKGKEFDVVVIFDGAHPPHRLTLKGDTASWERSRRLLHVGITRAREAVAIITPAAEPCPLLPRSR